MQLSESEFTHHENCPSCNSKDNLARYSDGHGYCFGCGYYEHGTTDGEPPKMTNRAQLSSNVVHKAAELHGSIAAISDRCISQATAQKYGVTTEYKSGTYEPAKHYYPYFTPQGKLQGAKVRLLDNKDFRTSGDMRSNGLFGQHLFKNDGKYVTVVEGELDALAAYEMLGSKWPVVSVSKGASGAAKDFKNNLEWLEGFENVVICFDNDEPGRIAAEQCAQVLSPNKARIVTLEDYKDAGDYLKNGMIKTFVDQWWNAKPYAMTGVVTLKDAWEAFLNQEDDEIVPFPDCFGSLNTMLNGGVAMGEVTVIGANTSIGKTTFINEIVYHLWKNTAHKIACAFLEADLKEVVLNLLTIHTSTNLRLEDRKNLDPEALYCDLIDDERINIFDHNGAADADDLFKKFRFMIKGRGCKVLLIDPLQVAVPGNSMESIDDFMDRLLKLAKETSCAIILVSHTRKPDTTRPHSITEYDLKGSGSINQIAFNTILLSRDKMADDEYARNSTMVQVVKCRRTGITGMASWVYYDQLTGRLERGKPPEVYQADQEDEF